MAENLDLDVSKIRENTSIYDMIESFMDNDDLGNKEKSRYDNIFSFYSARAKAGLKLPEKGASYYWIDLDTYDIRKKTWNEEAEDYLRFSTYNIYSTYDDAVTTFIRMYEFYESRDIKIKLDYNKSINKMYEIIGNRK